MFTLYHFPICPFSRQARVLLKEKKLSFILQKEDYWLKSRELMIINPAAELPVLIEINGRPLADIYAITEYLNEEYIHPSFMPEEALLRHEVRRLISWFNSKFHNEVTKYIIDEKLIKLLKKVGSPDSAAIRVAKTNLYNHLRYMAKLIEMKGNLADENLTVADFAAASHLSILDYFNEILWDNYPAVKNWYALIKSRPSFQALLHDRVPGFIPPRHYSDLDF